MNKRVLKICIGLLVFFILAFCVIKLFFPELLLTQIENEKLIMIGKFVDSHAVAKILVDTFNAVLAMHFYLSSCKQSWKLSSQIYILLFSYEIILSAVYLWNIYIGLAIDLTMFIVFPILLKSSPKQFIPLFIIHQVGQNALLFIRSQPLLMVDVTSVTRVILVLDAYAWLVLYYLYSNLNKEVTIWESLRFHFSEICRKLNWKKNLKK